MSLDLFIDVIFIFSLTFLMYKLFKLQLPK